MKTPGLGYSAMKTTPALLTVSLLAISTAIGHAQGQSAEWPQWRGQNRDGVVTSFAEPRSWPEQLTRRWKVEIGTGYATPLVAGPRLYLFSRQGEREVMTALDAESGKVLWQTGYPVSFTMNSASQRHGPGPKSTPVLSNGRLYSIGMTGVVTAFDAASGKQLWQKPGSDLVPMYTSHSFSPVVERGLVIFHVGGHNKGALTAYDVNTGDVKWTWAGDGPGYGSPVVADIGGTRQVVANTEGKLVGVDAASGALLWEVPFASSNFTNSLTPLVIGQNVIMANNIKPTTALTVTKDGARWATKVAWENPEAQIGRLSNAVVGGNVIFGLTNRNAGQYFAIDAATGKTLWTSEPRQANNAAVARAGNTFFSLEEDGELVVFRRAGDAFSEVKRYKVADSETWAAPSIVGNRIFVKDVSTVSLWTID
jgi:outer membrane protein assembly factor BamB